MTSSLTEQMLADWIRSRFFGKYRGTVSDNSDPTARGRLKVRVPAVLGDLEVWAMPCVPYAGAGVGFYSLPEPGTGVWVDFEAGDPSYPVWTGFFWGDGELPDANDANIKIWKTEKLTLRLDDGNDQIRLESTAQAKVTIAKEVVSEKGPAKHTVSSSGVVSEIAAGKVDVHQMGVTVDNGALEVK